MHYNLKTFEQKEQNHIVAKCIKEYKCHSYVIHWAYLEINAVTEQEMLFYSNNQAYEALLSK